MIKTAFYESNIYKIILIFMNAYEQSSLKMKMSIISEYAANSAIYRAYLKFIAKRDYVEFSVYQKALNRISEIISVPALAIHNYFKKPVEENGILNVYFRFTKRKRKLPGVLEGSFFVRAVCGLLK